VYAVVNQVASGYLARLALLLNVAFASGTVYVSIVNAYEKEIAAPKWVSGIWQVFMIGDRGQFWMHVGQIELAFIAF
jgi:hypothetical protein